MHHLFGFGSIISLKVRDRIPLSDRRLDCVGIETDDFPYLLVRHNSGCHPVFEGSLRDAEGFRHGGLPYVYWVSDSVVCHTDA